MQRELNLRLSESNNTYKRKLENRHRQNKERDVWSGMKIITGFKAKGDQAEGNLNSAKKMNMFFSRFSTGAHLRPQVSTSRPAALCLLFSGLSRRRYYLPTSVSHFSRGQGRQQFENDSEEAWVL